MQEQLFDPKQTNLPYTVGIIKPDTTLKPKIVQEVINKIENSGFIIKNFIQRDLFKEEVLNILYLHTTKPYIDDLLDYWMSGECIVLLLCHETENPIEKWKKMIGAMDPVEAKKVDPTSLRAQFGQSVIRNEFHGSDHPTGANKERDIFKFPIPQKVPEFSFNKMLISLENLFKFLYPPNLEHSNANERMDLFALYGPSVNYHSVDNCFCTPCSRICKALLEEVKDRKIADERAKLGISGKQLPANLAKTMSSGSQAMSKTDEKVKIAPIRLLIEEDQLKVWDQLCKKCQNHCDNFTHLCGGRNAQNIMTDQELSNLAIEVNKTDVLDLLMAEKGKAAKIMIETIDIREPSELLYTKDMITLLLRDLETDYYNRYQFYDLQQVILEDRRIRLNAWMSKLINKPIGRFRNPKLIDPTITAEQRKDPKSIHFTIQRQLPLSMTYKKQDITAAPIMFPPNLADKKRLDPNEEKLALLQKLNRDTHKMVSIEDVNKGDGYKIGVYLLRTYNEGRHGGWNNYCTLKGKDKGSYVGQSFKRKQEF